MNAKNIISTVLVALVTSVLATTVMLSTKATSEVTNDTNESEETTTLGALVATVKEGVHAFRSGITFGDEYVYFAKSGVIGVRANQGFWINNTGRDVQVQAQLGFTSGTASSSSNIYAATSSTNTIASDYVTPGGKYRIIDGANWATSTTARAVTSTTTSDGSQNWFTVRAGERVVFQVQDRYGCKTVGVCETATSTNRGITNYFWHILARYKP